MQAQNMKRCTSCRLCSRMSTTHSTGVTGVMFLASIETTGILIYAKSKTLRVNSSDPSKPYTAPVTPYVNAAGTPTTTETIAAATDATVAVRTLPIDRIAESRTTIADTRQLQIMKGHNAAEYAVYLSE